MTNEATESTQSTPGGNEKTLNMRELGLEVFPELDEISAERKASSTFKRACKELGVEPSTFKQGKEYRIPESSIIMWRLLLRNINAVEGNPSNNGYVHFVEDVILAKSEVDEQIKDLTSDEVEEDAFQQSMLTVYELFYTPTDHGQSIAKMFHNELTQLVRKDIDHIIENAPADRTVMYTEIYYSGMKNKVQKMGELTRKMIKEKWHEQ